MFIVILDQVFHCLDVGALHLVQELGELVCIVRGYKRSLSRFLETGI